MQRGKRILILVCSVAAIFIVALVTLAAFAAFLYYEKVDIWHNPIVERLTQATSTSSQPAGPAALTDRGDYKTENNWVAAKTAEDIAGFAWLATHPNSPLPNLKVKATVDPQKGLVHLELTGWADKPVVADLTPSYAWDPKAYSEFAHQLLGDQKPIEPAGPDTPDILTDLLTPTGEVLAQKDVELSKALSQSPASVSLHEKAALLLLTLAFRENACILSDVRLPLCRACAHLAVARALEGGDAGSWTGKVANASLVTLSGREVDALPQLDAIKAAAGIPPAVSSWIEALTLFNKQDWRIASPDHNAPLLVKIIWFQVVAENFNDSSAMTYLDRLGDLEPVPDWGRALLDANSWPSVDVGHRFCESTVGLEFQELKAILAAEGDTALTSLPLRDVFSHSVGPSITVDANGQNRVQVIGPDMFKATSERHIIFAAWQTHFWMRNSWGVPEEDAKFVQQMKTLFQGTRHEQYLTLFLNASQPNSFPSSGSLHDDVAEIPPSFAMHLNWPENECERLIPYFGWGIPFGAPFNAKIRATVILNAVTSHHHRDPNAPSYRDLMPLAPDSYTLASWVIVLHQNQHIPFTEKEEYALVERFFDYNARALNYFRSLADEQTDFDAATLEEILRKQAALDPDVFFELGDFLKAHGKDDEAADAYRKGAAQGIDQVLFANSIRPLVEYDFSHGQQEEAEAMASKAADIFSYDGIQTYIWLLCKLGRYDEAADWAGKIEDRYGGQERAYFYAAHADHFPAQFAAEVKKRFPDGMPTVSFASFSDAPKQGCFFETATPELTRAGLHVGDVVVGLDSHPVLNTDTYYFIRSMSDAPVMDLIVWQNGKYLEIKASPPNRRFGNQIGDYHR